MSRHHPKNTTLAEFVAGTLDEGRSLVVASHLAMCGECRGFVSALEQAGDWRQLALQAVKPSPSDEEKDFAAAKARFLALAEARPLHEARQALEAARAREPIDPALAGITPAGAPAAAVGIDTLLDAIDLAPGDDAARPTQAKQALSGAGLPVRPI